jgi:hypothetical protein
MDENDDLDPVPLSHLPTASFSYVQKKIVVEEIELGQLMHTMKTRNQRRRLGCASGRARKTRRICSVRLQRRLDPAQRSMVWRRQAEREDAADGGSPEIGWR